MRKFFSNTTRSFYWEEDKEVFDALGTWPADAVTVSEADWQSYQGVAPQWKLPAVDDNGEMYWIDDPSVDISAAVLRCNTERRDELLRKITQRAFPLLAAAAMKAATDEQKAELKNLQSYAVKLLNMTDLAEPKPAWPQIID
ncbi:tail fiber assembly protein [Enterobacter hormaechei]|uniref:tail fiber assembly protein n=1 Tax=Enterobacter hormaechei TaxID=158836 RepID=UPI001F197D29|nr:tail fiber assembly protein [Enterobacter hormaechei]